MSRSYPARRPNLRKIVITPEDVEKARTAFTYEDSDEGIGYLNLPNVDIVPKLTTLESHITQVILEDCVNQLLILSALRPRASHTLRYPTLHQRFGSGEIKEQLYDEDTNKLIRETRDSRRLLKIQKDRELFVKALLMTIEEAKETLTAVGLGELVSEEAKKLDADTQLTEDHGRAVEELKQLLEAEQRLKSTTKRLRQEKRSQIQFLQNEADSTILLSGVKTAYAKRWTEARREQNTISWSLEEFAINKELGQIAETTCVDTTVNTRTIRYLKLAIDELFADIERWTERYNEEIEEMDIEITGYKNKIEDMDKTIVKLDKIYAERAEEIEEYMVVKRERERIEEERLMKERAAVRIQAWWRGTMVRRHLGPYRISKKKKGKKKKK